AISFVLIAHFAYKYEHFGFWGVEMFFALSGYLIGQILWKSFSSQDSWSFSLMKNFWSRRWWRTLPNYYLFLVIMIFFHAYMSGHFIDFAKLSKFLWFGQNLFSRDGSFFGVSWSLCIEEWFYLLFPLLLFAVGRLKLGKKASFIITLVIFFVFSLLMRQHMINSGVGHSVRGITFARLDSISFGVIVAFAVSVCSLKRRILQFGLAIVGGFLLIGCYYAVYFSGQSYEQIKESQFVLTCTPLSFALMIPFFENIKATNSRIVNDWVLKMSLWSYSIYLSHIPVLFLVYELLEFMRDSTLGNLFSKVVGLMVSIGFSGFIFKYFEVLIMKKRPKDLTKNFNKGPR